MGRQQATGALVVRQADAADNMEAVQRFYPTPARRFILPSPEYMGMYAPYSMGAWFVIGFLSVLLSALFELLPALMLLLAFAVWVLPALVPMVVTVGDDGVSLRWVGYREFVPFARLQNAYLTGDERTAGLVIVQEGGREIPLTTARQILGAEARARAMVREIRLRAESARLAGRMACGGHAALEQPPQPESVVPYRAVPDVRSRLWTLMCNPVADAAVRERAVRLMAPHMGCLANQLRQQALATAHPGLRRVLQRASRAAQGHSRCLRPCPRCRSNCE